MVDLESWVKKLDERQCDWVLTEFERKNVPINYSRESISHKKDAILFSWRAYSEKRRQPGYIERIIENLPKKVLDKSHFSWIDNNNIRQCTWLFNQLIHFHPHVYNTSLMAPNLKYSYFLDWTMKYFDSLHEGLQPNGMSYPLKADLLSSLEGQWRSITTENYLFKWFKSRDVKQAQWAWDFIRKQHPVDCQIAPSTPVEMHGTVIGLVDGLFRTPPEKQLFSEKMKRAWSQKKYRDSLKGKKSYNIVMDVKIKKMLDDIAKNEDRHINATLERIIIEKHKTLSKKAI